MIATFPSPVTVNVPDSTDSATVLEILMKPQTGEWSILVAYDSGKTERVTSATIESPLYSAAATAVANLCLIRFGSTPTLS